MVLKRFIVLCVCVLQNCNAGTIPEATSETIVQPQVLECPATEAEHYNVLGLKIEDGNKKVMSVGDMKLTNDPRFSVLYDNETLIYSFAIIPGGDEIEVYRCDIVAPTGEILNSRDLIISSDGSISMDNTETEEPSSPPDKAKTNGIIQVGVANAPEKSPQIPPRMDYPTTPETSRTNEVSVDDTMSPDSPIISQITEQQMVNLGDLVILSCSFKNADINQLSWLTETGTGLKIPLSEGLVLFMVDPRVSVRHDSISSVYSLVINRIEEKDNGSYICQINSPDGFSVLTARNTNIDVKSTPVPAQMPDILPQTPNIPQIPNAGPPEVPTTYRGGDVVSPEISFISSMQSIKNGQMAILECAVRNGEDYAVSWSRANQAGSTKYEHVSVEDTILIDNDRFSITYDAPRATYILAIKDARTEDSGSYKCTVQITHNDFVEKEVTLDIYGQNQPVAPENPRPTQEATTEKCCNGNSEFTDRFSAKLSERILNKVIPKIRGIEASHRQMQVAVNRLKNDYSNLRNQLTTMKKREQKPEDVPNN